MPETAVVKLPSAVPGKYDFGLCSVQTATTHAVSVANTGTCRVDYAWEVPLGEKGQKLPFEVSPARGSIEPGESADAVATFYPREASVFVAAAVCRFESVGELPLKQGTGKTAVALNAAAAEEKKRGKQAAVLMVSGVGKYPFVRASATALDFGEVFIGQRLEKNLTLKNMGSVPAEWAVTRKAGQIVLTDPFTFAPSSGSLRPGASVTLRVSFRPSSCGLHSLQDYVLSTTGTTSATLSLTGVGYGPDLKVSSRRVHFGDVDLLAKPSKTGRRGASTGKAASAKPDATATATAAALPPTCSPTGREAVVAVTNPTAYPAAFQILNMERGGVFRCTPCHGVIKPGKTVNVKILFEPTYPMNYYRRVYLLSGGSVEPQWLDLMGTAFADRQRPPPLAFKHVAQMRAREKVGLGLLTPEETEVLLAKIRQGQPCGGGEEAEARAALQLAMSPPAFTAKAALLDVARTARPSSQGSRQQAFSIDVSYIDYGVVRARGGETRRVDVHNRTSSAAVARWAHDTGAVFAVDPPALDLPPFSSAAFNVTARAPQHASPALNVLECYVSYKSMRSAKLVADEHTVPPTCLTLTCTVRGDSRPSPVKAELSVSRVEFPPVHVGDVSFQTLCLRNDGDVAASFRVQGGADTLVGSAAAAADNTSGGGGGGGGAEERFGDTAHGATGGSSVSEIFLDNEGDLPLDNDGSFGDTGGGGGGGGVSAEEGGGGGGSVFSAYPSECVVPAKSSQVILLRFVGRRAATYACNMQVILEGSKSLPLAVQASAYTPALTLRNDGTVYFKPTFAGSTTVRPYTIENPCRIGVAYKWDVPHKFQHIIRVEPESGVLKGNETKSVKVFFTPDKAKAYTIHVPVVCMSVDGDQAVASSQTAVLIGEGTTGSLTLEPFEACIPTVLAGDCATREITLYNSTACETAYCMGWCPEGESSVEPEEVSLSEPVGSIPVRSHKTIILSFKPRRRGPYAFRVFCKAVSDEKQAWETSTRLTQSLPTQDEIELLPSCVVRGDGGFPVLEVSDIRCSAISKAHLWEQASVDAVNSLLAEDVTAFDLDRREFQFSEVCKRYDPQPLDFGAAVVNSHSTKIFLTLENTSELPAHYSFVFPCDTDVPAERWFHEDEPTDASLRVEKVLDKTLFQIEPAAASIAPHESLALQLTYKRTLAGMHTLPVLLKVRGGKRVLLLLRGYTLEEGARHLDMVAEAHSFSPVRVGDPRPPMQYSELRNTSLVPVTYELDSGPFAKIYEDNHHFPIFQCLNSYGEIAPMCSVMLQWYFRPLEAKEYQMTVSVAVKDGPAYPLALKGVGCHPDGSPPEGYPEFRPLRVFPTLPRMGVFPVVLSQDVLQFGRVSVHSLHRRLLLLKNTHAHDAFAFEWDTELQHGEQQLEMHPSSGVVEAGKHVVCRLTLYSGSMVHVIEQSIQCKVVNLGLASRRAQLCEAVEGEAALALEPEDERATSGGVEGAGGEGGASPVQSSLAAPFDFDPAILKRGSKRHKRQPVTQPPPRYQTTTQLRHTMERLLEAADPENLDEDSPELMWVPVMETYLDVRLQARVMDFDTYRKSDPDAWRKHFHPTLAVYQQVLHTPHTLPFPHFSISPLLTVPLSALKMRRFRCQTRFRLFMRRYVFAGVFSMWRGRERIATHPRATPGGAGGQQGSARDAAALRRPAVGADGPGPRGAAGESSDERRSDVRNGPPRRRVARCGA